MVADGSTPHTYTITVSNGAPSDAASVILSDTWPAGFTRGTVTPSTGTCDTTTNAPNFSCSFGTIASGGSVTVTATYTVPTTTTANQTNTATITSPTDSTAGNNSASDTDTVTPANHPPTANAGGPYSGNEGSPIQLSGSASDSDTGDTVTVAWTYTTGTNVDAGATCSFDPSNTVLSPKVTCTDDGTYTFTLTASDGKSTTSSSATVTVSNVKPVVTAANSTPNPYALNALVTVMANFTDAGKNDTHKTPPGGSCTVSWDDNSTPSNGTVTETPQSGTGSCSATHTYAAAGVYTVTTTVCDDDGLCGSDTTQVVVYDPSAGFITGGGWITVDQGSLVGTTASGRANFGFSSQYKKGATIPTGETEFNFQMGNFNFHSEAYSWLVVSGYKAQYKGTGSVNGVSGYDFTLTAYDGDAPSGGGVDKFRIRITRTNGGNVIFDNRMGVSSTDMDTANPEAISGGSIVIHKA